MIALDFKSGWWYKLNPAGYEYQDWVRDGLMYFLKDGEWHQCNAGNYASASFYDCHKPYRVWVLSAPQYWEESETNPYDVQEPKQPATSKLATSKYAVSLVFRNIEEAVENTLSVVEASSPAEAIGIAFQQNSYYFDDGFSLAMMPKVVS